MGGLLSSEPGCRGPAQFPQRTSVSGRMPWHMGCPAVCCDFLSGCPRPTAWGKLSRSSHSDGDRGPPQTSVLYYRLFFFIRNICQLKTSDSPMFKFPAPSDTWKIWLNRAGMSTRLRWPGRNGHAGRTRVPSAAPRRAIRCAQTHPGPQPLVRWITSLVDVGHTRRRECGACQGDPQSAFSVPVLSTPQPGSHMRPPPSPAPSPRATRC